MQSYVKRAVFIFVVQDTMHSVNVVIDDQSQLLPNGGHHSFECIAPLGLQKCLLITYGHTSIPRVENSQCERSMYFRIR